MALAPPDNWDRTINSELLNEETFEQLYHVYWQPLYNFALSKVHDKDAAEEIIQDLFVTIWDRRHNFSVANIKSYLFTSTRNRIIDHYKQRQFSDLDTIDESPAPDYPLFLDEFENQLASALGELPVKTREIFILNKIEGHNSKEVSKQLDIPVRTVEYHITQAQRKLRHLLKNVATYLFLLLSDMIF